MLYDVQIDEVDAKAKHVKEAKKLNIHVIGDTFFKECQKGGAAILIEQHRLAPWGGDVRLLHFVHP